MKRTKQLNNRQKWQLARNMAGLSLLEMMVALVIGTAIVSLTLVVYLNSLETAAYLNAFSRVQESGRFATDHIARTMRMSGYDDPVTTGVAPAIRGLYGRNSAHALGIVGKTPKPNTDAVQISYEGALGIIDCQGVQFETTPDDDNLWVTNTYAISTADELICRTVTSSGTVGAVVVIAEGIEDMILLYGVDSNADGVANRYVEWNDVADWSTVVAAKVHLLVNSVAEVWVNSIHTCKSCTVFNPTANNLLRGEFQTTLRIRNS